MCCPDSFGSSARASGAATKAPGPVSIPSRPGGTWSVGRRGGLPEMKPAFFFRASGDLPFNQHWLGQPSSPASLTHVHASHLTTPWHIAQHISASGMWSMAMPHCGPHRTKSVSSSMDPHCPANVTCASSCKPRSSKPRKPRRGKSSASAAPTSPRPATNAAAFSADRRDACRLRTQRAPASGVDGSTAVAPASASASVNRAL
mmetsp:Transcript_99532/g.304301  ORF Transcript_99532/g.304301 Transcript_99532/m.304301 type:complete len:203 (+) Transcript_99532:438-1046(+)